MTISRSDMRYFRARNAIEHNRTIGVAEEELTCDDRNRVAATMKSGAAQ
jgi:hypothetical protein